METTKSEVKDNSNLSQDFLEPETELQSWDFAAEQAKFAQEFSVLSWNFQEVQLVLSSSFQKVQLVLSSNFQMVQLLMIHVQMKDNPSGTEKTRQV